MVLFNENEREIWSTGLFRSRFSTLGQAPSIAPVTFRVTHHAFLPASFTTTCFEKWRRYLQPTSNTAECDVQADNIQGEG